MGLHRIDGTNAAGPDGAAGEQTWTRRMSIWGRRCHRCAMAGCPGRRWGDGVSSTRVRVLYALARGTTQTGRTAIQMTRALIRETVCVISQGSDARPGASLSLRSRCPWLVVRSSMPVCAHLLCAPPAAVASQAIPSACPTARHRVPCQSPSAPSVRSARNASASMDQVWLDFASRW